MAMQKKITVFTPTYNRAYILPKCYKSLSRQTCKDFEWLIIDDGSTDGSLELLKSMELDSDVTLIESPHVGKAQALNKGLDCVKTDYTIM